MGFTLTGVAAPLESGRTDRGDCSLRTLARIAGLAVLAAAAPALAEEQVVAGTFDAGWDDTWWGDGTFTPAVRDGLLCIDVPAGTINPWDAGFGQDGIALAEGREYVFQFRASGTPKGPIRAIIQMPREPWTEYVQIAVEATADPQVFSTKFTAPLSMEDGQLAFQVGGSAAAWTFCVDDVSVNDDPAATVAVVGPPSQGDANPQDTASRIRVNQLGFLPSGPKHATIVTDATGPLEFVVKDEIGIDVFRGMTEPRGFDRSAGLNVHIADFSAFNGVGEDFTVAADLDVSFPFDIDPDLYDPLRVDALSYFYPARSGIEILGSVAGEAYARPAGHLSSPGGTGNQGDLDVPCQPVETTAPLYGEPWTCNYTLDPTMGWYDAGDFGKYIVNGGISVGQMLAAYERALRVEEITAPNTEGVTALGDNTLRIPERGNGMSDLLDEVLWELQFFLEMTVPEGQPLAGMAHHKVHGATWGTLPEYPSADTIPRYLHRPSTAATLNVAATMAMAARLYDPSLSAFPSTALAAAEQAWDAAVANPTLFAPNADREGGGPYPDDDVTDEFYWAAAELLITTGDPKYLEALRASRWWTGEPFIPEGGDWKFVAPFAQLELATHPDVLPQADAERIQDTVFEAADRYLEVLGESGFGHAYAPTSGRYDWGSNHSVIQVALVLATAYDLSGEVRFRDGALESMDYILGRNALNQSYITGYGRKFSQNQHSSWMAPSLDPTLPRPLAGTLAGGPNSSLDDEVAAAFFAERGCAPQACYIDDIAAWSVNELAINWQAALAQFAAWLADQ
jgi:endoglucanase